MNPQRNASLANLLSGPETPRVSYVMLVDRERDAPVSHHPRDEERAAPPRTAHSPALIHGFLDELADDALDLALRLLVVDSLAAMLPRDERNRAFFAQADSLGALKDAVEDVCGLMSDRRVVRLIAPDAPLGAYVKGLLLRAAMVTRALERRGFGALAGAPDDRALARDLAEASEFHFTGLKGAIESDLSEARRELGGRAIARGCAEAVEKLFAAGTRMDRGGV